MDNKLTQTTPLRFEDEATPKSSLDRIDLNLFIEQARSAESWKENDRSTIVIYKSDSMRVMLLGLHKEAELKTHTANGAITVQVLEGTINFTAQQQTVTLSKGHMIALQEKIPHSVLALAESFFLLTLQVNKA